MDKWKGPMPPWSSISGHTATIKQEDWERLLPIAEFCYNNTQTGTTKITPFFTNYGYHPRFLPDLGTKNDETPEVLEYIEALRKLHEDLRAEINEAQMAKTEQANKARHLNPVMNPDDKVWLRRKHIRTTQPSNKLDHKQIGPYTILEKVDSHAYKLDLPATVKIYPVFHIGLLEPTASTEPIPRHHQVPPPPIIIQEQQKWEVEKILDSRHNRNQMQYRVKWTSFHDTYRTCYPARNFENSRDIVQQFHEEFPEKPYLPN